MTLLDALFNWLQIKKVYEARPDDHAAKDTHDFFEQMLKEDHHITHLEITQNEQNMYCVRYTAADNNPAVKLFHKEMVEKLLEDINSNPKYNE